MSENELNLLKEFRGVAAEGEELANMLLAFIVNRANQYNPKKVKGFILELENDLPGKIAFEIFNILRLVNGTKVYISRKDSRKIVFADEMHKKWYKKKGWLWMKLHKNKPGYIVIDGLHCHKSEVNNQRESTGAPLFLQITYTELQYIFNNLYVEREEA